MAASGVSGGSESDPGAIAPDDGGTGGDVGTGAGVADAAETSAEQDENSQETAGDTVSGGVNLSGLIGRYKHSWSITAGSSDGTSSLDIPFSGGTTSGGIFTVTLASNLTFPIPSAPGSLSFTGAGTESPFGLINGTSTLFPGSQFVLVEAFENSFPTDRIIGFAGTTTTTFPTTGATFYNYRRDFQLDSNVPFVLKASGGDILADPALSSSAEASATIYWNNSGSGSHRPFGFATGGVVGTQTSQKSVVSLIIGEVITATVDGVTRTFIAGESRASSRVSSSQAPHIIEGDASTAFGGGASFGQDIFFFGDNAGFFVMEGVDISDSGFKLNVGTEKIEDTITTASAATKFSPKHRVFARDQHAGDSNDAGNEWLHRRPDRRVQLLRPAGVIWHDAVLDLEHFEHEQQRSSARQCRRRHQRHHQQGSRAF